MLATVDLRACMRRLSAAVPIISICILHFICHARVVAQNNSQEASRSSLQLPLNLITLPPGFKISMYYDDYVPGARSMTISKGQNGNATIVYVGTRDKWSTVCPQVPLFQTVQTFIPGAALGGGLQSFLAAAFLLSMFAGCPTVGSIMGAFSAPCLWPCLLHIGGRSTIHS